MGVYGLTTGNHRPFGRENVSNAAKDIRLANVASLPYSLENIQVNDSPLRAFLSGNSNTSRFVL
jgi:hypothetical protein